MIRIKTCWKVTFEQRLEGNERTMHTDTQGRHSRGKGKSVQRIEGKSMPGMFKWHQGSQYTWREVIEQEIN